MTLRMEDAPADVNPLMWVITQETDRRRKEGLERVQEVLKRGEGHWHKVETFKAAIRKGTTEKVAEILEKISSTVREVEVKQGGLEELGQQQGMATIDIPLMVRRQTLVQDGSALSFPLLTHATFRHDTIRVPEFVPLLLQLAPNLTFLSATIDNFHTTGGMRNLRSVKEDTKLTHLEIEYTHASKWFKMGTTPPVEYPYINLVLSLLERSPALEKLAVSYETDLHRADGPVDDTLAKAVSKLKISDLSWTSGSIDCIANQAAWIGMGEAEMKSVKRMVVKHKHWAMPVSFRANISMSRY
jgi:hypothetical protein